MNKEELLLLHGLNGSADIFDGLKQKLEEKFEVRCPVLLGHGERIPLRRVPSADWKIQVFEQVKNPYAVIGVSFGATLALHIASITKPRKLVLVAPPLRLRTNVDEWVSVVCSYFPEFIQTRFPSVVRGTTRYPFGAVSKSVKLRREALPLISEINSDIMILFDPMDHLLDVGAVSDILLSRLQVPVTLKMFSGGGHSLLKGPYEEEIRDQLLKFIYDEN